MVVRPKSVVLGERLSFLAIILLVVLASLGWGEAVAQYGAVITIVANVIPIALFLAATLITTRGASFGG
ncbi:hypothetical protein P0F65_11645 [Sphingomonas sp. I4]